nr:MAG TPA: hypothetical protein [Siphoviridae sp. ct4aE30]
MRLMANTMGKPVRILASFLDEGESTQWTNLTIYRQTAKTGNITFPWR